MEGRGSGGTERTICPANPTRPTGQTGKKPPRLTRISPIRGGRKPPCEDARSGEANEVIPVFSVP